MKRLVTMDAPDDIIPAQCGIGPTLSLPVPLSSFNGPSFGLRHNSTLKRDGNRLALPVKPYQDMSPRQIDLLRDQPVRQEAHRPPMSPSRQI